MTVPSLTWLVPGDPDATLAALTTALEAGRMSPIERIRATWAARWLRDAYPGTAVAERAGAVVVQLDPAGCLPDQPSIAVLRGWVELYHRQAGRGSLSALARAAGLTPGDVTFVRRGRVVSLANQELIAAALIAIGRGETRCGTGTPENHLPNFPLSKKEILS